MNNNNHIFDKKYVSEESETKTPSEEKSIGIAQPFDYKIDTSKYKVNKPKRQIIRVKFSND